MHNAFGSAQADFSGVYSRSPDGAKLCVGDVLRKALLATQAGSKWRPRPPSLRLEASLTPELLQAALAHLRPPAKVDLFLDVEVLVRHAP